ncbi:MAG: signal peptidase I [Clostridia bacterium]|nr:signal peptidase I [Clostridia bacterium]
MWYKVRENLIDLKLSREREASRSLDLFFWSFIVILACLVLLRVFVFSSVIVSGTSMCDTLQSGDLLLVNKLYEPKNGDVIVFYAATIDEKGNIHYQLDENGQKTFYIKRIIACEGETVYWENGIVSRGYFDGENFVKTELDEPYAKGKTYTLHSIFDFEDNVEGTKVPENHYFVLGDNRPVSNDSRGTIGMVDERLILGVVPQFVINNKETVIRYLFRIF